MTNKKSLSTTTAQVPAHLRTDEARGLEDMASYQQVPRVKIVQSQAMRDVTRELQKEFGSGAVVVMPDRTLIAMADEPFHVVPLFWWPSWARWPDLNDSGGEQMVETTDPGSEIARLAKNPETWEQPYEDNPRLFHRNVENLNFACEVQDGPAAGSTAVFSFNRGSHFVGKNLCGYLNRRGVSIYGNRLRMQCSLTSNAAGQQFYRIEFRGADEPFVDAENLERLAAAHRAFSDAFAASQLWIVDEGETSK